MKDMNPSKGAISKWKYLLLLDYIALSSLNLVWSVSIPRYARDALEPNKVLGSLNNVILRPIFIASLLSP